MIVSGPIGRENSLRQNSSSGLIFVAFREQLPTSKVCGNVIGKSDVHFGKPFQASRSITLFSQLQSEGVMQE
jgi:hypothetical protein